MPKSRYPLLLVIWATGALAQNWPARIDAQNVLEYVQVLAGAGMEGRRSGTPGAEKAARYLSDQFRKAGLQPLGDNGTYLQRYTYPSFQYTGPCGLSIIDETEARALSYGSEFHILNLSGAGRCEAEVVYAGYGLSVPERNYDDYAGMDVSGKVVLCMEGAPGTAADWPLDRRAPYAKAKEAARRGARALLFFPDPDKGRQLPESHVWGFNKERWNADLLVAKIDAPVADLILQGIGTTAGLLKKAINASRKPRSQATGKRVSLSADVKVVEETVAWNVVGYIPGSGELAKESIVIGGHYDSGGVDPDGTIFLGAEDDASGIAITLELAAVMTRSGIRPHRSIVFGAWAAEEQGSSGHKYYLDHLPEAVPRIVAAFWLDNAGIGDGTFHSYGAVFFPHFYNFLLTGLSDRLRGQSIPGGIGASDFQNLGIPSLFTHATGPHAYNHTPYDAARLIQREAVQNIGDFVLHATGLLANTKTLPYRVADVESYWMRSSVLATAAPHKPGDIPARQDTSVDTQRLPELILVTQPRYDPRKLSQMRRDLSALGWTIVRDVAQVSAGGPPGVLLVLDASETRDLDVWWDLGARVLHLGRGIGQQWIDEAARAGFKFLVSDPGVLEDRKVTNPVLVLPAKLPLRPHLREKLVEAKGVLALAFAARPEDGKPSSTRPLSELMGRLKELRTELPVAQILLAPSYTKAGEAVLLSDVVGALRKEGWTQQEVAGVLGINLMRILRARNAP